MPALHCASGPSARSSSSIPLTTHIEGERAGHQTVVLKFESMDKAKEIYESGEYQAVVGKRHDATSKHFAVLVNGFG